MFARVADDLGGGVKAHRLGVEQGRAEDVGVVAFQPGRGVGDLGEARRVAFGEAIAAKALDLLDQPLGEILADAVGAHPFDQRIAEFADAAGHLEGRHRAAEPVGFARAETRTDDGDLHRLFLEQRHAQRLFQHLAQLRAGILDVDLADAALLAAFEIGVDHVALNRPRADDRHLDYDVVKLCGLHPRQHRHLRAAFDLEGAERVGLLNHRIGGGIILLHLGAVEPQVDALMLAQQIETAAQAAEHAKTEDIHLHQPDFLDIELFPFDHAAIDHRGGFDRHQIVEPVMREHEAAGMLRQMARRADQLRGEVERQRKARLAGIEVERGDMLLGHAVIRPAPDLRGERCGHVLGQAKRLADFAHRAA